MIPGRLKEYAEMEKEVHEIANRLVISRRHANYQHQLRLNIKDASRSRVYKPMNFYVDDIVFDDLDVEVIIVACTESGQHGYQNQFREEFTMAEFCDPLVLTDHAAYEDKLFKDLCKISP